MFGHTSPCFVTETHNLISMHFSLFGDVKELMRYKKQILHHRCRYYYYYYYHHYYYFQLTHYSLQGLLCDLG